MLWPLQCVQGNFSSYHFLGLLLVLGKRGEGSVSIWYQWWKNSHVLWNNWSLSLLKPHSSCSLLQMGQAPQHVCLGCYKDCIPCAREDGSAPIPLCQKGINLLLKTKKNPTLQSDPRPAFWESPDHILSLDGTPPQHLLALDSVPWLFDVYPMQPEVHHVWPLSRQILQREQTSHVLLQVTGVHLFMVNLLKAQALLSLNSWNRTQNFIQGSRKTLYIWPVLQIFKGFITQLFLMDVLADFWTFCLMLLHM